MNRVETLEVPPGQHIRDFIIRSGFYIDAIGFTTNQCQKLGPIGGTGGSLRPTSLNDYLYTYEKLQGRIYYYYIDGIRGKTVTTQGEKCICELEFKYVCIPLDESFKGPRGLTPRIKRYRDYPDYPEYYEWEAL